MGPGYLQGDYLGGDDTNVVLPYSQNDDDELLRQMQMQQQPGPAGGTPPFVAPSTAAAIARPSFDVSVPGMPPPPPGPDYAKLSQIYGERPQMTSPKWWQRALGGAAGFGAGWSNAASRTRNPIDIGQLRQNILEPGYAEKMAMWQNNQVLPAEQQANLASAQQQAWWKNYDTAARAAYFKAHADYMEGLGRGGNVTVTPEMEAITGGIFKQGSVIPQSTATEIARIAAGKYEKPEHTTVVTDPDLAKTMGVTPGTAVADSIYREALMRRGQTNKYQGLIPTPPGTALFNPETQRAVFTNPRQFDPVADEMRHERLQDQRDREADAILSQKQQREQSVMAQRDKDVSALLTRHSLTSEDDLWSNPQTSAELQAINHRYAPQLQNIQNNFASAVRRRGGTAEDWTIDPNTLEARQRGAQPQQPVNNTPAPQQQAAPASQGTPGSDPRKAYVPGERYGGMLFLGGDPYNAKSWQR